MKKWSRLCKEAGTRDWISQVARGLQAAKSCTRAKHAEKLNCHASYSITGQKVQSGHSVTSRLELAAQSSHEAKPPANSILKTDFSHSTLTLVYIPLIPTKCRELPERILREKP